VIDKSSGIPYYLQLVKEIKEKIKMGELRPDDQLSSENELQQEYNISRPTIRKALNVLVNDGYLYRIKGVGTFVSQPKIEEIMMNLQGWSATMRDKGLNPSTKVITMKETFPKNSLLDSGYFSPDEEIIKIERLRYIDKDPIVLEKSYIPKKLCPSLINDDLNNNSLNSLLTKKYNLTLLSGKVGFEPVLTKEREANLLQVYPGSPALLLDYYAFTFSKQIVEYCKRIVRGDKCRFWVEAVKR